MKGIGQEDIEIFDPLRIKCGFKVGLWSRPGGVGVKRMETGVALDFRLFEREGTGLGVGGLNSSLNRYGTINSNVMIKISHVCFLLQFYIYKKY